jgi:transposase
MTQRLNLPEGFKKENFKSLLKKRGQQKYGLRLLAMHYLQQGKTLQEVADLMETTIKTVRKWIQRYDLFGIEGLLSIQSGRGRKSMLLLQHKEE